MVWMPQLPRLAEAVRGLMRNPEGGQARGARGSHRLWDVIKAGLSRGHKWLQ